VYRYYRCVTRDKRGRDACPGKPLPADAIEDFVVARIREVVTGAENAAALAAPIRERVELRRRALAGEQRAIGKRIPELSVVVERLTTTLPAAAGDAHRRAEQQLEAAVAELDAAHARLHEVERRIAALAAAEAEADWVEHALVNFSDLWDVMTPVNRRRLIEALIQEIVVDEPAGRIEAHSAELPINDEYSADFPESADTEIDTTFADKEAS
jgi:hypothetical protein